MRYISDIAARLGGLLEDAGVDVSRVADVLSYNPAEPLLFNTGLFLVLFVVFMALYSVVRNTRAPKMLLVIAFSMYFYYKSSGWACIILLGVCISDYLLGLAMGKARAGWLRRLIVAVNVVVNVGMLVYFKYFRLIVDTLSDFLSADISVASVLLPAGISFFTFRSISYIVDLYRGVITPCRNMMDYVFFLTFFPPLLAGPVVRAKDMLPQIKANLPATRDMVSEGIFLIMVGLVKKVVIADFISGNFVDRVFDNPALYSGFENLMASIGFTVQLYCDFSGYSDMAIGIALLLGYRFRENFNAPFKAQNPTEFWHRWHISLSTWLRDYVYIPLGGNRCSRTQMYFNQFATMVIGGFWHGASWMYVIWGGVHGSLLVCHKMLRRYFPAEASETVVTDSGELVVVTRKVEPSPLVKGINIVLTFMLVAVTFMFFRARSLEDVGMMWHQIIYDFHLSVAPQFVEGYLTIVIAIVGALFVHLLPARVGETALSIFRRTPILLQALLLAVVLLVVIQVRQSDIVPFIYLQY